jgi:hypothetical protein
MAHYGDNCRSFHIVLLDNDIENVFPTSYAWWTARERRCWGDGNSAIGEPRKSRAAWGGPPAEPSLVITSLSLRTADLLVAQCNASVNHLAGSGR